MPIDERSRGTASIIQHASALRARQPSPPSLAEFLEDVASKLGAIGAAVLLPHSVARPYITVAMMAHGFSFPSTLGIAAEIAKEGVHPATLESDLSPPSLRALSAEAVCSCLLVSYRYADGHGFVCFAFPDRPQEEVYQRAVTTATEIWRFFEELELQVSLRAVQTLAAIPRLAAADTIIREVLTVVQSSLDCAEVHLLRIHTRTPSELSYFDHCLRGTQYSKTVASASRGALYEAVHRSRAMLLDRTATSPEGNTFAGTLYSAETPTSGDRRQRSFSADFARHPSAQSIALMPVVRAGVTDAVLKLIDPETTGRFGIRDLAWLGVLARALSGLLADVMTQERATRDSRLDARALLENAEALFFYREVATGIFHQIRNLLSNIGAKLLSAGTLLDLKPAEISQARDETDDCQKIIREAARLIDNIERRGKNFAIQPRRCQLVAEIVRPVLQKKKSAIDAAGMVLTQTLTDDDYEVEVDPTMMQEALTNVINNAITAIKKHRGGRAEVFVAVREKKTERQVVVVVRDTGIGMDQETLGKVGTAFFTTDREKGTGLGVYFARVMVERFGGTLQFVYSQPARGSEVHITLPRR